MYAERAKSLHSVSEFFLNLIPTTVFDAFSKGDILQVLVFAILFGAGLSLAGEAGRPVLTGLYSLASVLFKVIGLKVWSGLAKQTCTSGLSLLCQLRNIHSFGLRDRPPNRGLQYLQIHRIPA
jgi:hypothetical protein